MTDNEQYQVFKYGVTLDVNDHELSPEGRAEALAMIGGTEEELAALAEYGRTGMVPSRKETA
jgi:hypothetical protein